MYVDLLGTAVRCLRITGNLSVVFSECQPINRLSYQVSTDGTVMQVIQTNGRRDHGVETVFPRFGGSSHAGTHAGTILAPVYDGQACC